MLGGNRRIAPWDIIQLPKGFLESFMDPFECRNCFVNPRAPRAGAEGIAFSFKACLFAICVAPPPPRLDHDLVPVVYVGLDILAEGREVLRTKIADAGFVDVEIFKFVYEEWFQLILVQLGTLKLLHGPLDVTEVMKAIQVDLAPMRLGLGARS